MISEEAKLLDPLHGGWGSDFGRGMTMFRGWFVPVCYGVLVFPVRQTGPETFIISWMSWAGSPASVRVLSDGLPIGETTSDSLVVTVAIGENFDFEVVDDPRYVPRANPSRAWLQVYVNDSEVDHLEVVEESATGDPVVARLRYTGPGYYRYETRELEDGETHEFSIRARRNDAADSGNVKVVRTFIVHRTPDMPLVTMTGVGVFEVS